ncbi:MAG TPA: hypothetical protein VNI20_03440 [Fimbriimonadaceae bacterium]|nr:hypothetical protein [Fimbriimonadaceae bacterium]
MSRIRPYLVFAAWFWIVAALQQTLGTRAMIGSASPDFLLTLGLVAAVMYPPRIACLLGFTAGVLHGGIAGADLSGLAISRTLACFGAGFVSRLDLEIKPVYVALVVFAGTLAAQVMMMVPAPPPAAWVYVRDTLFGAMYNAALALPVYLLLRRSLRHRMN